MDREAMELFAQLAGRLETFAAQQSIPGTCLGFVRNGELGFVRGFGETQIGNGTVPTENAVFRIASMTKSFTAAAILLLRDRGVIGLDDAISAYLPWTESIGAPADGPPISVRDLLTMNAGLPTDDPWGDRHESTPVDRFDAIVGAGLSFTRVPRTGFEYSNAGYALLGRIITRASGIDYLDFVARELLAPLRMRSTTFHSAHIDPARRAHGYAPVETGLRPEPTTQAGAFSPMGGLHSTLSDLTTWITGFASAWNAPNEHPLRGATRREMQEGRTFCRALAIDACGDAAAKTITTLYGYGLFVAIDSELGTFVHHSGAYPGFASHMRWHPASGLGIIVLANRSYAPIYDVAADLLAQAVAALAGRSDVESTLWPQTRAAMDVAERLLTCWDDALADRSFAFNVDLDTPRAERRAAAARVSARIGSPFSRRRDGWCSLSAAHVKWMVRGPVGDAELEILLTPERPPKIQTLKIAVADPPSSA
jgi:CubicO group peptidase (beta-lactamase class C family)